MKDYRERWEDAWIATVDWQNERAGRETFAARIERTSSEGTLSRRSDNHESFAFADEREEWDFDPEVHSAAEHVEDKFENIGNKADVAFYSRAKGAWDWLRNTVGVDLKKIEHRWREFPVLIIPEHVSNRHGLTEPKSLYSYLTDIRLAYMIGANLAAIAMCRAATEILIRYHYNSDPNMERKLTPLVEATQKRRKFAFLKPRNLVTKIEDANNILHFKDDIKSPDRRRTIVRDWVKALQVVIDGAPRPREHVDHA